MSFLPVADGLWGHTQTCATGSGLRPFRFAALQPSSDACGTFHPISGSDTKENSSSKVSQLKILMLKVWGEDHTWRIDASSPPRLKPDQIMPPECLQFLLVRQRSPGAQREQRSTK
ncbi:hypothetical protein KIL84_002390 [Mauremys mutica]|uniref:Uncharacterized protein n=1 Tax=Mauremys mutica TaxID=74926 RepID=A0A9D3X6Q1_9SAUR|nr:hypothetical protein KIL84_002390 [Mauremys mutica]